MSEQITLEFLKTLIDQHEDRLKGIEAVLAPPKIGGKGKRFRRWCGAIVPRVHRVDGGFAVSFGAPPQKVNTVGA